MQKNILCEKYDECIQPLPPRQDRKRSQSRVNRPYASSISARTNDTHTQNTKH